MHCTESMMMGINLSKSVLFFVFILCVGIFLMEMAMAQNTTIPVKVGVVLYDSDDWVGKMWLSCINMSLLHFYENNGHYKTRLVLHTRDSNGDVVGAAAAALDLIKNVKVQAILGPATSMQANFVIELGEKAKVPIISFSASSTFLRSHYFFQASQNDKTQVNAISAIVEAFGWREAVIVYTDNEYGVGIVSYLMGALQEIDTRVPHQSAISPSASDDQIVQELYKLMTMQTRVFIVHALPTLSVRLFTKAKEIGMMNAGYVWIMTDWMTNLFSSLDSSVIDSMQGALGVRPYVPKSKELEYFRVRWKRKFYQDHPDMVDADLQIFGLWAYDATMALAMAIENTGTTNFRFRRGNVSSNPTDLENFEVSQNGPDLVKALSNISFKGLTGDFLFVNQQLQPSAFQVVNVNDAGPRGIGFWTPEKGLVKKLKSLTNSPSAFNKPSNVATIIWPGDSTSVPKGWEIPTNGKRLRIGVPVKDGFTAFVNISRNLITNATRVTGYCIDVFDAAVEQLPYAVAYDYIPFATPDGKNAGSYDDLVYQVYLGNYDAVVGDTTIIANRTLYIDFTFPFTESDVAMLVRIKDRRINNAMIFLMPLSGGLWFTTLGSFIFIGILVWVLEHRTNGDFQGSGFDQVSTSLWYSFSTMVFAHREKVFNNWARSVIIVWCFFLLILTQSYTASLTSLLTARRLEPEISDMIELIQNRELVGYQRGSFVYEILRKVGFQENQLLSYNTPEELHELLSERSGNRSLAAAFDESPYMKLVLAKYCTNYIMVEPPRFMLKMPGRDSQQFKTDGFGFVFPKGSPLARDMSGAILKVIQDDEMRRIEDAWFSELSKCPDHTNSVSASTLDLDSFWVLFAIVGGISVIGFVEYTSNFVHENRNILASDGSIWSRVVKLLIKFCETDQHPPNSRKSEVNVTNATDGVQNETDGAQDATDGPTNAANDAGDHNGQERASGQTTQAMDQNSEGTNRNQGGPSISEITEEKD